MNKTSFLGAAGTVLAIVLVVGACGDAAGDVLPTAPPTVATPPTAAVPTTSPPTTPIPTTVPVFDCPVTIPVPGEFTAPDPYPATHPDAGLAWYGADGLWTALAVDGVHGQRKSVWWSTNFPGGDQEERPALQVTWTRLDADPPVVHRHDEPGTNAFTGDEGWFMISGIDPPDAGCWHVEATYKGATLGYVYEQS